MDRETENETLVWLHGGSAPRRSEAHGVLAQRFRIVDVDMTGLSCEEAVRKIASAGIATCSVIGHGAEARFALALALADPETVQALVLLAPPKIGDPGLDPEALSRVTAPVLALFGTNDEASPPALGDAYGEALANCHLMMVYDAGHDLDADRPQAVAAIVTDFLRRRERFLVAEDSGLIHP